METERMDDCHEFVLSYGGNSRETNRRNRSDEINNAIHNTKPKTRSNDGFCDDMILDHGEVITLAHEIKNPLTNIALSMAYLREENADPERSIYFDIINRSTKRINDLVNGLLASTTREFSKEGCLLNELVSEALELAIDRITLKKVTIHENYQAQNCRVEVDKPRYKIALLNIIVNAIEAVKQGAGHLYLETRSHHDISEVIIRDNGAGIKKENIARLFDPYYSNKKTGTGIGLMVAKQVFDWHSSIVDVHSEEGFGTVFTITLQSLQPD